MLFLLWRVLGDILFVRVDEVTKCTNWFSFAAFGFFFTRTRFVLNDPDGISINLGFIFRALLPPSGIIKLADFLERALVVLFAHGNVFTVEWTYAVVNRYHMPLCYGLGFSARGFFSNLEVASAFVVWPLCCMVLLEHLRMRKVTLVVIELHSKVTGGLSNVDKL